MNSWLGWTMFVVLVINMLYYVDKDLKRQGHAGIPILRHIFDGLSFKKNVTNDKGEENVNRAKFFDGESSASKKSKGKEKKKSSNKRSKKPKASKSSKKEKRRVDKPHKDQDDKLNTKGN